jgi:hypothetical protein
VSREVECEGSPRDCGRDQGRACADALRERFARLELGARLRLRLGGLGGNGLALRRELSRHFPRQVETLAGMSVAAGVPAAWLAACLESECAGGPEEIAGAVGGEVSRSGAVVARALGGEWIVRRSRPEGAFRSVEVTRPWLAHALLGVNEAGLAVAVVRPDLTSLAFGSLRGRFAALPAAPLALDCLQRFATLEACLDWCASRPGERPAALLFADAAGEVAGIEIAPGRRRILRSAEGWLAAGGSAAAREEMGKTLRESGGLAGDPRSSHGGAFAFADPAARSLRLGPARYAV